MSKAAASGEIASQRADEGGAVPADSAPSPVATSVTPSGIEIAYYVEPKRKYEIRSPERPDGSHNYDWLEVPSVTTVLDVLDKPALPWWGMKVGIAGMIQLFNEGLLGGASVDGQIVLAGWPERGLPAVIGVSDAVDLLTRNQLTVNHLRDKASDRGMVVHSTLEAWAEHGVMPDPSIHSEEEAGYVAGLKQFLIHTQPEPLDSEVMVGSLEYGYAGRYDLRFKIKKEREVVFHRTPKRGPQLATLKPGNYLTDLKTSKGVYSTHSEQLEAYEQASIEDGYEPTEGRGILHVGADGTYEFVRSWGTFDDFRATLDKYKLSQAMTKRAPKGYR